MSVPIILMKKLNGKHLIKNAGVSATRTPADSHFPEQDYGLTKIPFSLR